MVIAVDPGHGMGAVNPGVLDEGVVARYRGERYTEQGLALVYAVALDEALKQEGFRTVLLREDTKQERPESTRAEIALAARADLAVRVHFLADPSLKQRGFQVSYSVHPEMLGLAWVLWDALCGYLPFRQGPQGCVRGSFFGGHDIRWIELALGHLTSDEDMQLLTEGYFKLRVCEGLAKAFRSYAAAQSAA